MNLKSWFELRAHTDPVLAKMKTKTVPQHRQTFWYTFGGFALFLIALQFITGLLLMMRYVPSAAPAVDAMSGKQLCMVRAIDSVVVVEVDDSTLSDYIFHQHLAIAYSGKPESAVPLELQGKCTILNTIPKDSSYLVPYSLHAAEPDDDTNIAPSPIIEEHADIPLELRDHLIIVRDTNTGRIIHPSAAFASIERITHAVPMGSFIRSLHAYGANLFVACIFLHMLSVFMMKGYRNPRELMWLSGVLLFAIALGFGFTGYLLPWNALSYFATRVGVGYPESFIPGIGGWIASVLRGGEEVSGETLTRMFAMHVVALPLLAMLLVGIHSIVLQVHGVSSPVDVRERGMNIIAAAAGAVSLAVLGLYAGTVRAFDITSPWVIVPLTVLPMVAAFYLGEIILGAKRNSSGALRPVPFYWNFAMRDYIGWLIGLAVLVVLAIKAPWHVGGAAGAPVDTTTTLQTPPGIHPEWYFMFAFQFLRIIPGEIAMMIFAAAGAAWFLIPFLDKQSQRGEKSKKFTRFGIVIIIALLALTWFGYQAADEETNGAQGSGVMK